MRHRQGTYVVDGAIEDLEGDYNLAGVVSSDDLALWLELYSLTKKSARSQVVGNNAFQI